MKINKYNSLALAAMAVVGMSSCNDNYEKLPVDSYTYEYLFSTTDSAGTNALGFLSPMYDALKSGHNGYGSDYLDAGSDDALPIDMDGNPDVLKLELGTYTSSNRVSSDMRWGDYYKVIRKANIFVGGIDRVPFKATYVNALGQTKQLGVSLKAEARFLRAWNYFELLKRYGGVPLMGDKVYDIEDNIELPRNTFEECVNYIVSELDDIKDSLRKLPMQDAAIYAHAVTKQACMALKSRVLLYAASPLFNENPIEAGNELVGYASYDRERWKVAADAAKEFIDEFGPNGDGSMGLASDYRRIFTTYYSPETNPEIIFFRQNGSSTSVENNNGPLGFTGNAQGNGRTNPTQDLIDAFPMKDGKAIGTSTKYVYDSQNPYANRDPRLDLEILHNGSKWLGTTLQTNQGGVNNPTSSADYSTTSYYMCKFMEDYSNRTEYASTQHQWIFLRYAELLLNYAEAANEYYGPTADVYDAIIQLRKRAGIEAGDDNLYGLDANMTRDEMRQVIHNERRIEMAFEEQRYFDIRRWREAESIYQQPLHGMRIQSNGVQATYSVIDVLTVNWDNNRYLYPIPYDEVNKNDNMVQNPNWK